MALVFQDIAAKAIVNLCRVPLLHLPLHPFFGEKMALLGGDELKMGLLLFFLTRSFPKSAYGIGEAFWEQMHCCGLCCGKGTGVLGWRVSVLCAAPIQSLSENACLPQRPTAVPLAFMRTAFLGKLCHLQKTLCGQNDLGWCPSPGLNARGRQLTLLSTGGYEDKTSPGSGSPSATNS